MIVGRSLEILKEVHALCPTLVGQMLWSNHSEQSTNGVGSTNIGQTMSDMFEQWLRPWLNKSADLPGS